MIGSIRRIIKVSGKYRGRIEVAFIFAFLKSMIQNAALIMAVLLVDGFINNTLTEQSFLIYGLTLFGCLVAQAIFIHIADRLQSAAGFMLMADWRIKMGEHLRRLPMGYFTEGNIGKISSVLSTDMVFIEENSMMTLADSMNYFFSAIIFAVFLLIFNLPIGIVYCIGSLLIVILGELKYKSGISLSMDRQKQSESLTKAVLDHVEGIGIIKTYNLLGEKSAKLKENFDKSCKESLRFEHKQVPFGIWINILFEVASIALGVTSAVLFLQGAISLTHFLAMLLFTLNFFISLRIVYMEGEKLSIMDKCLDRIEEIMNVPELPDYGKKQLQGFVPGVPAVEFKNVSFSYDKKETISDVSFKVSEGETIALVGPSGSGKTTIASLLARFWDINKGDILINGTSIREVPLAVLLEQISMVFQNVYLFNDTVYNNIAMGRPEATKEEVIEAAKKARCYDFILSLPKGFDTIIGEGGASLSGGEKQRISIARCILKDSPIVILDEATASIDADNEAAIQQAISELCKGKTLIIIAHRLKTIKEADCIYVINNGKIAESGDHDALMSKQGIYTRFVEIKNNDTGWCKRKIG
ncbi:MAG: ABC transporter ATP-binding protein [Lachnospiraceae bacterium]|nr:ABC transporter ATP-binding protein [Lachnospiraceae bacterium]